MGRQGGREMGGGGVEEAAEFQVPPRPAQPQVEGIAEDLSPIPKSYAVGNGNGLP